jgi:DNA-binding NarL/FixJ family response regulator
LVSAAGSPQTAPARLAGPAARAAGPAISFGLTPRETQVLRLVAAGFSNSDIVADLFISKRTVSVHVSDILGSP